LAAGDAGHSGVDPLSAFGRWLRDAASRSRGSSLLHPYPPRSVVRAGEGLEVLPVIPAEAAPRRKGPPSYRVRKKAARAAYRGEEQP